ncbi:type II CRISPR RNA-guided endonuclease Cas9 [Aquibacillus sp. 3ASR75-11]|uniref:CRISPR-associated endonuclease Cas9 n=1 Tax=Terrihalobacillus insolitus TaxID=2950438 RepID=A0A9X3WYI1_9BACI|nr:type II CRISPR RNA-guided endonuclease Cas9 [Terrihalobacillus insolitus]MDC3425729.1 type II CRISPR RNA-guided endonuclease Cas9 [Terrihalobacillus insolitus]
MKTNDGNYTLGLDIGIGSVGWGVIDEKQEIVDAGTRLFPEADVSNNNGRRSYRSTRRLLRRRSHRIQRIKNLLKEFELINDVEEIDYRDINTPYHIRVKGLSEKLSKNDIAVALVHLGKRRGIHNVEASEADKNENELSTKEQINRNEKNLVDRYVCELQLERLDKNGQVRGHENRFKTSDYVKEAKQILKTQANYYREIDSEFIEKYINLIETRREYYEGPGFGSQYGWDQDIKKWYEEMMGRCSYYPEELRAVKESYSAQLFNLLNELNNLVINRDENDKLTQVEKENMVSEVFIKYKNVTLTRLAKQLDVEVHDIKGYKVNASGTPIFTQLTIYHDVRKITEKQLLINNPDLLDQIAEITTIFQSPEDVKEELEKLNLPVNEEELNELSKLNYSKTHSLSLKLIKQILPDLWSTPKNQMELFSEMGISPEKVKLTNRKYIPYDHIDDWILSPVVKRSLKQSIRVINEIMKKYGTPKEIVIELAREKNSQDKKNFLNDLNKKNAALNRQVKEKLESKDINASKGLFNMLRLWHLQDGFCLYSLRPIPLDKLLNNPSLYEIDHIIPRSVSFDDSQNNRVLVAREENQQKGNMTPFQYFRSNETSVSYEKFKVHVLQLAKSKDKIPKKKLHYLLEERDINKFDVQKEFINRNLVDTRYATREILFLLSAFFKENNKGVKVKSINGSFTNYLRNLWKFKKDRGVDFKHHAEDALIVAMASYIFEQKSEFVNQNMILSEDKKADRETGEILDESTFKATFTDKYHKIQAVKNYKNFKYSHRIDKKPNRQLMNDTLYSTRKKDNKEYVIEKIKNLYDKDNDKLSKLINKNPDKLLMYHNDRQTFEQLKKIMDQYSEAKNPLYKFHEEEGEFVRKYSKRGNGPIIKSMKYYGSLLKEHKDMSHKFTSKNKRVVNLSLKPFRMDVFFDDGVYKFITIRYNDLIEIKDGFILDEKVYHDKLRAKSIENVKNFIFSLYKNDLLEINREEYRLIGVNQDTVNKIEINNITNDYKEYSRINNIKTNRIFKYISKNTSSFNKISTDVLGNRYINKNEKIKFFYPKE